MPKKCGSGEKRDGRGDCRNYRKEYDKFQSSPSDIQNRSERNQARARAGLRVGDPREVDHKKPLSKGGSNGNSNTRVVSRATNRKKGSS